MLCRILTVALLLASCGSAKASTAGGSTPETVPTATASDAQAAFPTNIVLTTKDGEIATFSPNAGPIVFPGVMAQAGDVAVSAASASGATTIEWHDLATGATTASATIDGEFRPTAVDPDGNLVALVSSAAMSTTVAVASRAQGEMARWTFDSVVVPEAFANAFVSEGGGLPVGIFVIEYLAANSYRVRVIDTATGQLGLPLNLRDKSQTVDEVMTAVSRTAVFDPMRRLLFTLYQDATEDGENIGSFIHTLGLFNGVWCLDVPEELGLADHPGALAVSPDGSRLYAASSTGGVAGYVIDDITNGGPAMPMARTIAALGGDAFRVAMGASNSEVVVGLDGRLFRLDPVTLEVRDSFTWDMGIEALTVLSDGSIVIVGTRRMTLVSPDDQLLAERPIGELAEITRVTAVG